MVSLLPIICIMLVLSQNTKPIMMPPELKQKLSILIIKMKTELRILQRCFQGIKYSRYPLLPLNISNECTLEFEKYIRVIIDDVERSHCVVVMNALSLFWSGSDTNP